jgi:hypothetical protein
MTNSEEATVMTKIIKELMEKERSYYFEKRGANTARIAEVRKIIERHAPKTNTK